MYSNANVKQFNRNISSKNELLELKLIKENFKGILDMSTTLQERKYVTFNLNNEFFAIDVHSVTEVFVPSSITSIPNAPEFVSGIINFRGVIVTCIDLKKRLSIKTSNTLTQKANEDDDKQLYVIIIKADNTILGLLVDYVESVVTITNENIQSTLDLISDKTSSAFIDGVANIDKNLLIILSLNTILSEFDINELDKLAKIRESVLTEQGNEEIVVTHSQLNDMDQDDISKLESRIKQMPTNSTDKGELGQSPLDLNILSKAELLKVAIEMGIDGVNTKSTKTQIVDAIKGKMGE